MAVLEIGRAGKKEEGLYWNRGEYIREQKRKQKEVRKLFLLSGDWETHETGNNFSVCKGGRTGVKEEYSAIQLQHPKFTDAEN